MTKKDSCRALQVIPGVGASIANDLWMQGYRVPSDLQGEDPEAMYNKQCELQGVKVDRCLLYVFRCAVYFASHAEHNPELLKWWNWKEKDSLSSF